MAIGLSIFLITIGAIFRFGITVSLRTLNFKAIGVIIMFAGAALLTIQLIFILRARAVSDRRDNGYGDSTSQGPTYRDTTYRDDNRPPVLARAGQARAGTGSDVDQFMAVSAGLGDVVPGPPGTTPDGYPRSRGHSSY